MLVVNGKRNRDVGLGGFFVFLPKQIVGGEEPKISKEKNSLWTVLSLHKMCGPFSLIVKATQPFMGHVARGGWREEILSIWASCLLRERERGNIPIVMGRVWISVNWKKNIFFLSHLVYVSPSDKKE